MILCVLGTHADPFDRAVDALLEARGEAELVIQHGATPSRPGLPRAAWHRFLPYDELTALMREADAVVCHAGVGTLMTAVSLGRVPVAMPRLRAHGEHVDDHQAQIARELGSAGYVIPCVEGADLPAALRRAGSAGAGRRTTSGDLRHAAILAAGGRPAPAGPATEI